MGHYSSPTPKRHAAWGNSPAIRKLDRGKLHISKRPKTGVRTAELYEDRNGKKRYKGTKALRGTERLVSKD